MGSEQNAPEGPYPGLRPFLASETNIFFGREQMSDEVLVRLNERHMVVVHGASGCGKSSLVAAGVLPQLARRRARRGLKLRVGSFRPGHRPMHRLVETLADLCTGQGGAAAIPEMYRAIAQGAQARTALARIAKQEGVDQACIVVDQFEELFRFAEDGSFEEAQRFAEILVSLAGAGDRPPNWWDEEQKPPDAEAAEADICFLVTMRSEFLGDCSRYPGLAEAINRTQYLLPNMERPDLIRAIREPAEVFGGSVDHALAERIADDAAREQDSLPLVQHALMQLWRDDDDRHLVVADYELALERCGQSEQLRQRSPLGAILAGHADRVLRSVTGGDAERLAAAGFIFRALTRKDSEGRAIRCPQRLRRLERVSGVAPAATREIVDGFRQEGVSLLTPYQAMQPAIDADTVIDISHEALIRTWPRMSDRTIDPADAQPIGWVEREAQEAMLWRWVAVHAEFFRSNPRAHLDGATTDRLTAWFDTIARRPDWVRPHLIHVEECSDIRDQPEWQSVAHLLAESRKRTWFDRQLLSRWKKLGRFSLVLVGLLLAGLAWAGLWFLDHWTEEQAAEELQRARQQVSTSVYVTGNIVQQINLKRRSGSPSEEDERVRDQTARVAAGEPGVASLVGNMPTGYFWIGSSGPAGLVSNLVGGANERIAPNAVQANADYRVVGNLVVRSGYPTSDYRPAEAIGVITSGTPVRALAAPTAFPIKGRTEYWVHARLVPANPLPVRLLHSGGSRLVPRLTNRLAEVGYSLRAAGGAVENGQAEVVYCRAQDRQPAFRLAASASRELTRLAGMEATIVAPMQGADCSRTADPTLRLYIDLRPTGS